MRFREYLPNAPWQGPPLPRRMSRRFDGRFNGRTNRNFAYSRQYTLNGFKPDTREDIEKSKYLSGYRGPLEAAIRERMRRLI